MIDISIGAEIACMNERVGKCTYVIANPINQRLTHLVVQYNRPPFDEYVVPVTQVAETSPHLINLKCTQEQLLQMELFHYREYIRVRMPDYEHMHDRYLAWPLVMPAMSFADDHLDYIPVDRENIPANEAAIRRGACVQARDGYVGRVDELLVNSNTMQVAFLVLRENHPFGHRDVTIPVSQIERTDENSVYLKLDQKSIGELPTVPVKHWPPFGNGGHGCGEEA